MWRRTLPWVLVFLAIGAIVNVAAARYSRVAHHLLWYYGMEAMMQSARLRRSLKRNHRLVLWGFVVYLFVLVGSLWIIFTKPAMMLLFCGVVIVASLFFVAVATIVNARERRFLGMLAKYNYLVCPKCLQPLEQHSQSCLCSRCGAQYTMDELHMEWASVLMASSE